MIEPTEIERVFYKGRGITMKRCFENYTHEELVGEAFEWISALTPEELVDVLEKVGLNIGKIICANGIGA